MNFTAGISLQELPGAQMPVPGSTQAAVSSGLSTQEKSQKAMHAARQFEAILLNSLLEPLQKAFSSLPGDDDQAGSGEYQSMETQALATGLANAGGLGIAPMIAHSLLNAK
ncbi:MAG TPA: hypothetical protein VFY05_02990 [Candidatus Angelobacter sp.]|nr:hypothetical protein [Candidatus Angelobacter sp.]